MDTLHWRIREFSAVTTAALHITNQKVLHYVCFWFYFECNNNKSQSIIIVTLIRDIDWRICCRSFELSCCSHCSCCHWHRGYLVSTVTSHTSQKPAQYLIHATTKCKNLTNSNRASIRQHKRVLRSSKILPICLVIRAQFFMTSNRNL